MITKFIAKLGKPAPWLLFAVILLVAMAPLLWNVYIENFTEFFIAPIKSLGGILSTWSEINFGTNPTIGLWRFFPLAIIYYLLGTVLHIPLVLIQFVVITGMFTLGAVGFYKLAAYIFKPNEPLHKWGVLAGTLLYIFNPYSIIQLTNTFTAAIPHMLLPGTFYLFIRSFENKSRWWNLFVISLILALVLGINPVFGAIYFAVLGSYGLWQVVVTKMWRWRPYVTSVLAIGILTILLALWWLLPFYISHTQDTATQQYVLNSENFYHFETSPSQVIRMLGDWSFFGSHRSIPYYSYAMNYRTNLVVLAAGFLLVGLAILGMSQWKKWRPKIRKDVLFFVVSIIVLLPVIGGTFAAWPTSGLMDWAYRKIPYVEMFRNSYKWTTWLVLDYSIVIVGLLTHWKVRRPHIYTLGSLAIWGLVMVYAFPYFTSQAFLEKRLFAGLPTYWQEAAQNVNSHVNDYQRIMLLPNQYFPVYKWGNDRNVFRKLESGLFDVPLVGNTCKGCGQAHTMEFLSDLYKSTAQPNAFKLAGLSGISHLLQRNDFDYDYYNSESPDQVRQILTSQQDTKHTETYGKLDFYKIDNTYVNPLFYGAQSLTMFNDYDEARAAFDYLPQLAAGAAIALPGQMPDEHMDSAGYFQKAFGTQIGLANHRAMDEITLPTSGDYIIEKGHHDKTFLLSYSSNNNNYQISLKQPSEKILLDDSVVYDNRGKELIKTINTAIPVDRPVILEIGGKVYYLTPGKTDEDLGSIGLDTTKTPKLSIYAADTGPTSNNLIQNGSFEKGTWESKVQNCNLTDPAAELGMSIDNDAADGQNSLKLSSKKDSACTHANIAEQPSGNSIYVVQFDARNIAGQPPAFCVWDGVGCVLYKSLRNEKKWQQYTHAVKVSPGATTLQLYLYSHKGNYPETINLFDNITVHKAGNEIVALPLALGDFETFGQKTVRLERGSHKLSSPLTTLPGNLIENGSFENGLWTDRVRNCRDLGGNPTLSVERSDDASDGRFSLELAASDEVACISSDVIHENQYDRNYVVSLDYKIIEGKVGEFCIWDGTHCLVDQKLDGAPGQWHNYQALVKSEVESKFLTAFLYAPTNKGSSRVRYDNVVFRAVQSPLSPFGVYSATSKQLGGVEVHKITKNSSTNYSLKANIRKPGLLVFSQSYHPGWQVYIKRAGSKKAGLLQRLSLIQEGHKISNNQHVIANGFANGWWIDPAALPANISNGEGDYEIVVKYEPQKWLNTGGVISGTTFIGCVVYSGLKRKKQLRADKRLPYSIQEPR